VILRFLIFAILCSAWSGTAREVTAGEDGNAPTFNRDIAPIVFNHCSGCHRPGQSAPFNLLTYADVTKRAKQIREVVEKRIMPPWLPEKGSVPFANDRSLSSQQISLIRRWVENGLQEGVGARPELPHWNEGWQLGTPDLIVKLSQPYVLKPEGKDVYRNFVIPIPVSARKFVKGVELSPGNSKVVHHAFINIDTTGYSRKRVDKDEPPGFDGMALPETAAMPGGQSLSWQPGKMHSFAGPGLAWALEPKTDLVLQLHLHPTGKPETLQPSVGFFFTDEPPTNTPFRLNLNPLNLDIPAEAKDYVVEDRYVVPVDIRLLSVLPHAHYLARRMEGYAVLPDGTRKDLLLIKDWDFNWQGDYQYAIPVELPRGSTLAMKFTYDNSTGNPHNPNHPPKRVRYGLQTTDEMAELWFQVLPRNLTERNLLGADFAKHLANLTVEYNEAVVKENPNDAEAHTRAGRDQIFLKQVPQAMAHLETAVRVAPDYDRAWYELGYLNLGLDRLPEAQHAFESVVRLNPLDYQAEGNLGNICMRRGDLEGAESHLRAALRINPQDAVARQNLDLVLNAKARKR